MTTFKYSPSIFAVLSCVVTLSFAKHFMMPAQPVQAAGYQAWEYKTFVRARGFYMSGGQPYLNDKDDCYEDSVAIPCPDDYGKKRNELGAQGWELVNMVPSVEVQLVNTRDTSYTYFYKRPKR